VAQAIAQSIDQFCLLVGEGKDEEKFFQALLGSLGRKDIQVESFGGKPKLKDYLRGLKVRTGFSGLTRLGLVLDADEDPQAALRQIQDALLATALPALIPSSSQGTAGVLRTYALILPSSTERGMLEDLCLAALAEDPVLGCVDSYFDCVRKTRPPLPRHLSKARLKTWLASREPPDLQSLGIAAEKGWFDWNHAAFTPLRQFVQAL
jgi:hypothetical protein